MTSYLGHGHTVLDMEFQENPSNVNEIQLWDYCLPLVKYTSLFTDRDKTYMPCRHGDKMLCGSRKLLWMEEDTRTRRYLVLQVKRSSLIATKIIFLKQRGHRVLDMKFQECLSNKGWDRTEKVLCSPSKVHFIVDTSQPNLCVLWGINCEFISVLLQITKEIYCVRDISFIN
jgi:hypothetical protein